MQMVNVRLVADRPNHKDLLYGSGIEWAKQGDVRPVPEPTWQRMKVHADVYELAPEAARQAGPTLADSSPSVSVLGSDSSPSVRGTADLLIPSATNMSQGAAAAAAALTPTEVKASIPGPEADPIADVAKEELRPLSPEMLAQIDDAAVHAEIERRGFTVGKSFTGPRLRERFLAEQAKRG
jgi:hypothetical protein